MDEIEAAHRAIGGVRRGRRYATQQINQAYVMMLSSQFQGFCRDLHSEAVDLICTQGAVHDSRRDILRRCLTEGRKLDSGNPNPGNIGSDFGRLGLRFWDQVLANAPINVGRQADLDLLNHWRNVIGHQDFTSPKLNGRKTLQLAQVRHWRVVCGSLAVEFEAVISDYLAIILGQRPW